MNSHLDIWNAEVMTTPQSVLITGRRWFQRSAGNTYFSAHGYIDGELVASIDFAYGYGDYYVQAITDEFERLGYMPNREHYSNGGAQPAWQYFRDQLGANYATEVTDVSRKKDL